eukprot:TRINITY_DN1325_c0_g1_i1.p1 TRINITY_DN1325_c0_g1~~TRINITY_DN1325_c0_g1_i1.p1  ORF type:complete len:348 (-),score=116.93 TRINITY_DN1325_c0_g1_i1:405-1448(-)
MASPPSSWHGEGQSLLFPGESFSLPMSVPARPTLVSIFPKRRSRPYDAAGSPFSDNFLSHCEQSLEVMKSMPVKKRCLSMFLSDTPAGGYISSEDAHMTDDVESPDGVFEMDVEEDMELETGHVDEVEKTCLHPPLPPKAALRRRRASDFGSSLVDDLCDDDDGGAACDEHQTHATASIIGNPCWASTDSHCDGGCCEGSGDLLTGVDLKDGMTHRQLACFFGLSDEKTTHFRLRDFRRSLVSKLSKEHLDCIMASPFDRGVLCNSSGRRKMTPAEFAEKLLVVQFHYQVHNGRLPSFAAKVSGTMFQELLGKSMRGYFPDIGSRVFALAKSGLSLQDAMNKARSEI